MQQSAGKTGTEWSSLLQTIAEQIKVPLMIISRQAELGEMAGDAGALDAVAVRTQADMALQLVDSYVLGMELMRNQTVLELEPVSIQSTLADTAHVLSRFAAQYNVELRLDAAGKYGPVMAHARGLRAALLSLGFGLVEAHMPETTVDRARHTTLTLAAHRTPRGIVAGVYGGNGSLNARAWHEALQLCGRAPQPFTGLGSGTGAGLFVADTILRSMHSGLQVGVRSRQRGLAAAFQHSQQLQFV